MVDPFNELYMYVSMYALQRIFGVLSLFNKGHCIGFQSHEIRGAFITYTIGFRVSPIGLLGAM